MTPLFGLSPFRRGGTLLGLVAAFLAACSPSPALPDASFTGQGCPDFFIYDGGVLGSASQAYDVAQAAVNAWSHGLGMTALTGRVGPDGTDQTDGGSWLFTFDSASGLGYAYVHPLAAQTILNGDCSYDFTKSNTPRPPQIANWPVDSSSACAIAADAGCPLAALNAMRLLGAPISPLGNHAAWEITARAPDGGFVTCVVDAVTGVYGPHPDGGGDAG